MPGVDLAALRAHPPADLVSSADGPGATAVSAQLDVGTDATNGLVLTPDEEMLTDQDTVFPLFIDPQIGPQRTKWAYANDINSNWDVGGQAWVGVNPFDGTPYRSFFDFPTTYGGQTYKGKHVLSASFSIKLDHSWSCSDTWAHLYRTSAITVGNGARMSWGTRPLGSGAKWLDSAEGHANEAGGCGSTQPDMLMTFGATETMRADVQAAATAHQNTYTVGICACNADGNYESTQDRWKRFHVNSDTTMSVTYNTVPGTPANLSPHLGQVACGGVVGTTSPVLRAQYVDADGSDTLSATFRWQELPSGTVNSVAGTTKPANNFGTATLSLGSGAEGESYQFQVRTHDGHDYSPWSPWCGFTVDTTAPPAPVVTPVVSGAAPVYVECDPENISTCVASGGPGVSGAFTFSQPPGPAGQDVIKYVYGWDSPGIEVTVAPGASHGPILVTPPHYGINTLAAYSVDGSGKQSPTTTFTFLVDGPSGPVGHWPLDSIDGHGFTDQVSGTPLSTSGVTWMPDARYIGADAADFDGTSGAASATVAALDTAQSFSVTAWVRLDVFPGTASMDVVSMTDTGADVVAFDLGVRQSGSPSLPHWAFVMRDTSAFFSLSTVVLAPAALSAADVGRWTHLVGIYDAAEQVLRLYVDGEPVAHTARTVTPWPASGPVKIGLRVTKKNPGNHWNGQIADVRLFNRVVVHDDVWGTDADPGTGVPAQPGLMTALQVGSWRFPDGECYCADSLDSSPFSRSLFLTPNWSIDPGWSGDPETTPAWLTGDSHDGDGGLRLDGAAGFASTTDDNATVGTGDDIDHPVLRTDQSFAAAAWVYLSATTGVEQVVFSQGDSSLSAMKLFLGADGYWSFAVSNQDGQGGHTWVAAKSDAPAAVDSWVHLAGVFDAATGQVRLYVDDQLQALTQAGAVGWPSADSLHIGANTNSASGFFGGTIDQAHVWQGVLTAREIHNLVLAT